MYSRGQRTVQGIIIFIKTIFQFKTFCIFYVLVFRREIINHFQKIYQYYFENLGQIPTTKFKIENWDAGWWQIRNALGDVNLGKETMTELKALHNQLHDKILPEISRYGIL